MTDRELLEKAAKAAGIVLIGPVEKYIVQFEERHAGGFIVRNDRGGDSAWNPLGDDGDALRLAVRLRLDVCRPYAEHPAVCVWLDKEADFLEEPHGDDPYAATRRAIVRAAAEMAEKEAVRG